MDNYLAEVVNPGDRVSKLAKLVNQASYHNCPAVYVVDESMGSFRGPASIIWAPHILVEQLKSYDATGQPTGLWPMVDTIENDGAGGKPMFFGLAGTKAAFRNLGWEIITMTVDDLARTGRFPAVMTNEVCFKQVTEDNYPLVEAMFEGFGKALKRAGLVSLTGETAIMKYQITSLFGSDSPKQVSLTWGGTCHGLRSSNLFFDGSTIEPEMAIVGFWEPGYRCNGGTWLAELVAATWGKDPVRIRRVPEARAFVQKLTIPSLSYARTITRLAGWLPDGSIRQPLVDIRGAAHITGGGLWGKFGELLPEGIGANLNSMPVPADVLLEAQRLSRDTSLEKDDWHMYSTTHGGCGMMLIVPIRDCTSVIREADKDGIRAMVVGATTKSTKSEVLVHSQFNFARDKVLSSLETSS